MQITFDLPDEVFSALRQTPDEFVLSMRTAAAINWYQKGVISQEKAATIAGMNRLSFLELLAREKIDVFHVDIEELQEELKRD